MSANGFLNRSLLGLPIIGRNAVSFGYGGFGGIVPIVVVCLAGDAQDNAAAGGVVEIDAIVNGPVETNSPTIMGAVQDNVAITGDVRAEALLTGPVLQSC